MESLNELKEIHKHRFEFTHILSSPNELWTGVKGRISTEILKNHIPKGLKKPLFCVCGPSQFTQKTLEYVKLINLFNYLILKINFFYFKRSLNSLGYTDDKIHAFIN